MTETTSTPGPDETTPPVEQPIEAPAAAIPTAETDQATPAEETEPAAEETDPPAEEQGVFTALI